MGSCERSRWPASPAPGPLVLRLGFGQEVTFKRTQLVPAIFWATCPGNKILPVIHGTKLMDWFAIFVPKISANREKEPFLKLFRNVRKRNDH